MCAKSKVSAANYIRANAHKNQPKAIMCEAHDKCVLELVTRIRWESAYGY